jgi:glycosyltransferase involved in cell wall biosynthesis
VRVAHVIPDVWMEAAGPSYSVPRLCAALAGQGAQVELHAFGPKPAWFDDRVRYHEYRPFPVLRGVSLAMHLALRERARTCDILHNHSLWMMPNVSAGLVARGARCRLVTAPRGTLSQWALRRSGWKKRVALALGQWAALREAACLHATAESEYADIRRMGLRQPVAVIPNGVDIPDLSTQHPRSASGARRVLFLGRIHPVKGIDSLLRAWSQLQKRFGEWELRIVGEDSGGYLAEMQRLARELGCQRVEFAGPAYGQAKSREYQAADLFVLPTRSENFGMTVAESLAHGMPVLVSKGAPWARLERERCGWWVDLAEGPLVEGLRAALSEPEDRLRAMGLRGRQWMERDFSWTQVGRLMMSVYLWLVGQGSTPECVRLT